MDDFTRSLCNFFCFPTEKLSYEAIGALLTCLREARALVGNDLALWKADIDSAYRRIPVAAESGDRSWVVFKRNGKPVAARHYALPFGSVASVHHWDRIGTAGVLQWRTFCVDGLAVQASSSKQSRGEC